MGELTIVGHEQQALSLGIETPDREHPRLIGPHVDDGGPTLRIVGGSDDPGRFVEQVVDEVGPHPDRSTVDGNDLGLDIDPLAEFGDDPVDRHPALSDDLLTDPPAAEPDSGQDLLQPLSLRVRLAVAHSSSPP